MQDGRVTLHAGSFPCLSGGSGEVETVNSRENEPFLARRGGKCYLDGLTRNFKVRVRTLCWTIASLSQAVYILEDTRAAVLPGPPQKATGKP